VKLGEAEIQPHRFVFFEHLDFIASKRSSFDGALHLGLFERLGGNHSLALSQ